MFGSVGHTGITFGLVSRLREAATTDACGFARPRAAWRQVLAWTRSAAGGLSFGRLPNQAFQLGSLR
jgi:hypothetical protein